MPEERLEEISAKVAGQSFSAKGVHLYTLLTLIVLVLIAAITSGLFIHMQATDTRMIALVDAIKDQSRLMQGVVKEQTATIKESGSAMREMACLSLYEIKERFNHATECKAQAR